MKDKFNELERNIREKQRYPIYVTADWKYTSVYWYSKSVSRYSSYMYQGIMYISAYYDTANMYCTRNFSNLCLYIHEVYTVQYSYFCQN